MVCPDGAMSALKLVNIMTAYELFRKAKVHYMGQWIGHNLPYMDQFIDPRVYVLQAFDMCLDDYYVGIETGGKGFVLTFEYNPENPTPLLLEYLQSIEVQAGYWLCYYDGHTGDWLLMLCADKSEAFKTYKRLYQRYFRKQTWIHTLKI